MRCRLCGYQFDPKEGACRAGCPLGCGCQMICCPHCYYPTLDDTQSRLANLLRRLWRRRGEGEPALVQRVGDEARLPGEGEAAGVKQAGAAGWQPVNAVPLASLPSGSEGIVRDLDGMPPARLARLSALGVVPGRRVKVLQRRPAPVVRIAEMELALSEEILAQIQVRPEGDEGTEGTEGDDGAEGAGAP